MTSVDPIRRLNQWVTNRNVPVDAPIDDLCFNVSAYSKGSKRLIDVFQLVVINIKPCIQTEIHAKRLDPFVPFEAEIGERFSRRLRNVAVNLRQPAATQTPLS
jgi:hypothetical protein